MTEFKAACSFQIAAAAGVKPHDSFLTHLIVPKVEKYFFSLVWHPASFITQRLVSGNLSGVGFGSGPAACLILREEGVL
jgi:hypothetical protein